jgi:hypothetical protein
MAGSATACPECGMGMQSIKLIDATGRAWKGASGHVELAYAALDAKASSFTGTIPALGTVKGMICPGCGRIVLRGEPRAS